MLRSVKRLAHPAGLGAALATALAVLGLAEMAMAQPASKIGPDEDPMHSAQSQAVRAAFAECRKKGNSLEAYFCACDVVDAQCDAVRDPSHGDWRTVELWTGEEDHEREVYFELAQNDLEASILDMAPQTVIVACLAGQTEVTIHFADDADHSLPITLRIGETLIPTQIADDEDRLIAVASEADSARHHMRQSDVMTLSYTDHWGETVEHALDIRGFDAVTRGWEPLCDPSLM